MVIKGIRGFMGVGEMISPQLTAKIAIEMLFRPGGKKIKPKHKEFWSLGKPLDFPSGCEGRLFGSGSKTIWVVHGWQSHSARFSKIIDLCLDNDYKVIAWNGPAHGGSFGHRTNLAAFTRALVKDIKSYNSEINVLLGHSFEAAASAYASSLGVQVDNLILVASPANAKEVFERFWDFIGLEKKSRKFFMKKTEKEMLVNLDEMSLDNFVKILPQDRILIIHDEDDKIIPYSDAQRIKKLSPKIRLHTTRGLGHYRVVGAKETLGEIESFLKEIERS